MYSFIRVVGATAPSFWMFLDWSLSRDSSGERVAGVLGGLAYWLAVLPCIRYKLGNWETFMILACLFGVPHKWKYGIFGARWGPTYSCEKDVSLWCMRCT